MNTNKTAKLFSKALSGALLLSLLLNCGGETPVDVTATESSATTFSSGVIPSSTGESTNPLDTTLSSSNTDISNPSSSAVAVVPTSSSSSQSTVPVSSSVGGSDPVSSSSSVVVPPVSSSSSTPGDAVYLNLQGDSGVYVDPRDNNDYKWVKVGTQIWMAQNLRYDGNGTLGEADGVYAGTGNYAPDYDHTGDGDVNGYYYTWSAAMTIDLVYDSTVYDGNMVNIRGICPEGWRLPMNADFKQLGDYIAQDQGMPAVVSDTIPDIADYLRTTSGWNIGAYGTNTYGLSFAPFGLYSFYSNDFVNGSIEASFWTSENTGGTLFAYKWMIELHNRDTDFYRYRLSKRQGYSVRCIAN